MNTRSKHKYNFPRSRLSKLIQKHAMLFALCCLLSCTIKAGGNEEIIELKPFEVETERGVWEYYSNSYSRQYSTDTQLCSATVYEAGEQNSATGERRGVSRWEDDNGCTNIDIGDPGTSPGTGEEGPGNGGGGSGGSGGSCGANPFTVYDGNVSRKISDLRMDGRAPLHWVRYHNSIPRTVARPFGEGASWRHGWQYDLQTRIDKDGAAVMVLVYPSGFRRTFRKQLDGSYIASEKRYTETLTAISDSRIEITLASKHVLSFSLAKSNVGTANNNIYQLDAITDENGVVTARLEYNGGLLRRVTNDQEEYINISYRGMDLRNTGSRIIGKIDEVPPPNQWLVFDMPEEHAKKLIKQVSLTRATGGQLAVAEIQIFGPDSEVSLQCVSARGTGAGIEAAFDGNNETIYESNAPGGDNVAIFNLGDKSRQRIASVWILPAPGQEHLLVGAELKFLPTFGIIKQQCIDRVENSNGRSVTYEYEIKASPLTDREYLTLVRARYGDGTEAVYKYNMVSPTQRPLLVEADDPRYDGRAKHIGYKYHKDRPHGTIHEELNPLTGSVYATLEFDLADPDRRIVRYTDDRVIEYRTPEKSNGRLTEYTDSLGRKISRTYANNGRGSLASNTDVSNRRTEYGRDEKNNIVNIISSEGYRTDITRDAKGEIRTLIDNRGKSLTFARDAKGRVVSASKTMEIKGESKPGRSARGTSQVPLRMMREMSFERDNRGRISRQQLEDGTSREFVYDAAGNVSVFRDKHGRTHHFAYDAKGRMVSRKNPDGQVTHYGFDQYGRRNSATDPMGQTSSVERNERGLITKMVNPDGSRRLFSYDKYGRKITETDEIDRKAAWEYDSLSRLVRTQDFAGGVTSFDYTETPGGCGTCSLISNPTRITHPDGRIDEFLYDTEGRLLMRSVAVGTEHLAITMYAYDDADNLTQQTNPDGGVIKHSYDINKRRLSTTDPLGRTTFWAYDEEGNILTQTDASGRTTEYVYDADNNLIYTVTADGAETTHTYDAANRRISTTDAMGNTTRWNYNKVGELISTIDATGAKTSHSYDSARRCTQTIFPDGTRQTWTYNAKGQVSQTTNPDNMTIKNEYDPMGRVIGTSYTPVGASRVASASATHTTYDAAGRRTSVTDALNRTTHYEYNIRNQVSAITYPGGTQTRQEYDSAGRVIADIDQLGHIIRYTYSALGDQKSLTDANGNTYTFEYDKMQRKIAMIYPDNTKEQWAYNFGGRLISYTSRAGQIKTIIYNIDGKPLSETWLPAGCAPNVNYTYDGTGRLVYTDNGNALLTYTYDKLGRIASETVDTRALLPNIAPHTVGYLHDALGRKAGLIYPDGMKVTYRYDATGRMTEVYNGNAKPLAAYDYDSYGRRSKISRDNGVLTHYTYDASSQVIAIDHHNRNNTPLAFAHYEYDSMGRRTSMTREDKPTDRYSYDATSQLVGVNYGDSRKETFIYDPVGNRVKHVATNPGEAPITRQYETNWLNQYTHIAIGSGIGARDEQSLSCDDNGNLIFDGNQHYEYDAQNRLIEIRKDLKKIKFHYDVIGRCIVQVLYNKSVESEEYQEASIEVFTHDARWNVIGSSLNNFDEKKYIYNINDECLQMQTADNSIYILFDLLNSVIATYDERAKLTNLMQYDATGLPMGAVLDERVAFTGSEWLSAFKLSRHQNRYYNQNISRWLTIDPIRFKGGANLYCYVHNNITNKVDSRGLYQSNPAEQNCLGYALGSDSSIYPNTSAQESLKDVVEEFGFTCSHTVGACSDDADMVLYIYSYDNNPNNQHPYSDPWIRGGNNDYHAIRRNNNGKWEAFPVRMDKSDIGCDTVSETPDPSDPDSYYRDQPRPVPYNKYCCQQ